METLQNILSQQSVQRLGWTLIHFIWQGALVALLLAVILRFLKRSSSSLRYTTAFVALAVMVVLPMITIRTIVISVPGVNPIFLKADHVQIIDTTNEIKADLPQGEKFANLKPFTPPKWFLKERFIKTIESLLPYVVFGWLIGVFVLSIWYLGGWTQMRRLRKRMVKQVSSDVKIKLKRLSQLLGIDKAVEIVESALVQVPMVVGHIKPVILLPASALTGLSSEQIEAILAHELAHIKRCDYLVNILQTVVEILGFYHPAVWWVSNKIRAERENCCDDLAVEISGDKVCYAEALATMEEIRFGQPALAVAASGGSLFERICRLLGKDTANSEKAGWLPSVIAIAFIMALLIPLCFALPSRSFGDVKNRDGVKTVTLPVYGEPSDSVDSIIVSLFDFSSEKTISITVDLKGLSQREKGSRVLNTLFAEKADITIKDDGEIVVFGPSTAEFEGMTLKEISDIGAERLAAHIRAEEKGRPSEFIDLSSFWNQWLNPGEVGALLTEDGVVVAIQAGEFVAGSKKGEFKYIILGNVDPQNLPEPKLIRDIVVRNKLIGVSENPEFIKNVAKEFFNKIQTADYNGLMNSGKQGWWSDFPVWDNYMTEKWQDKLVIWMCQTFKENPIVKIELGEVFTSDVRDMKLNNLPAVPYKLTLKDGGVLEGNLPFRYVVDKNNKAGGYWQGLHGIDWHLQENPIKKPNEAAKDKFSQQVLTTVRILSVPQDWPRLKELFPAKKINAFTPEELEEFLKVVKADASVKILSAPRVTTSDGEDAVIKIESIEFRIKNNVQPDRKSINAVFELKYTCGGLQKTSNEISGFLPSNSAFVVRGGEPCDGNEIILIVQPKVLEAGNAPEQTGVVKSGDVIASNENFNILDVNFEPIRQGRNILWLTVQNKSDKEQFFGINVYSRSVDYGPQGVGWGTSYREKFDAWQTKKLRYVYKIQGPITKNTYTRLQFYNVKSLIHEENRDIKPFAEKQYSTEDLKIYSTSNVQFAAASSEQLKAVSQALAEIQKYLRSGDYGKAWNLFSSDYQKAEYQGKGLEGFKLQMEPKHPLNSAFLWEKRDFLKLKSVSAYMNEGKVVLIASADTAEWKIDFVQQDGRWKIDWITGYRPKILDMQEKDAKRQ